MLEFDHLPFGVADADGSRALFGGLGFTATTTGVCRWTLQGRSHAARATSVVFARGYLDLIEMRDAGWQRHLQISPVYGKGITPSGLVLHATSFEEARARVAACGIPVRDSYEIVRQLPGAVPPEIHYELASLAEPSVPVAIIRDSAPDAMRTENWLRHANSVTGVRAVHLRVPSLDAWMSRTALIFAAGPASAVAAEFALGDTTLVVHEDPRDPYLTAVSSLLPRRDRAALLAIEFSCADLDAARTLLARSATPSIELGGGTAVLPSAGCGCGMIFTDVHCPTRACI